MRGAVKKLLIHVIPGERHENSLAANGNQWIGWIWFFCIISWILGIALPIVTVTKFAIFTTEYSIVKITIDLLTGYDVFLAIIVFGFSIAGPIFKFDQLWRVWRRYDATGEMARKAIRRLDLIGRWSMADVFIVAIAVVIAKTGDFFANANVGIGLYFFAASALGSMLLGQFLKSKIHTTGSV